LKQFPDASFQFLKIDRFGEMEIEPGFLSALDIVLHAETGESDCWCRARLSNSLD
jgi:hypothetical protein